jgi:YegS/Rv2252/BmrU family lipid kinase
VSPPVCQYASPVPPPICLIVNPAAGGGRGGRAAPAVVDALRARGLTVRREDTRSLDHARELALRAAHTGEIAVTLGGDGLAGAVADALRGVPGAILGVLPGGRGNDLARVLGIGQDPVAACATIAGGVARELDLGVVGEHSYVGIASCGFDSDANRIANEAPPWLGNLVYAYGALRALVAWRPARFELVLDGEPHTFTGYSVGACNSKAYGGGMYAAPDAELDDGLLDIVYCEQISKLRFLARILPKVFKGTHVREPSVHVLRGRDLRIAADRPFTMYADGDPIGELPLRVSALPHAVRVLVPAASPLGGARPVDAESSEVSADSAAGRSRGEP